MLDSTNWLVCSLSTTSESRCSDPPEARLTQKKTSAAAAESAAQAADAARPRRSYLPAEERRRQILDAAREVFSRSSLQGARTRDLARAAGVNQATLYGHFESKEALFAEAIVQPLVDAMQGMQERAGTYRSAGSPAELLQLAEDSCRNHLESMVDIYPLLTAALFSDPELGAKLYSEQIKPLFERRGEAMSQVIKGSIEPQLFSLLAFGMFFAVAMDRSFTGRDTDLASTARQIAELAAFGFARDPLRDGEPGEGDAGG